MDTLPEARGLRSTTAPDAIDILVPTLLEYLAIRSVIPFCRVTLCGIGLSRSYPLGDCPLITCGLAGALTESLAPGDVVIPEVVGLESGTVVPCDPELVEALRRGAYAINRVPTPARMLTATSIVTGNARSRWASRGFDVVDMETGFLIPTGRRIASIRVVLDTPCHPIADDWLNPRLALTQPRFWREGLWLGQAAPRYARRAALVLRAALAILGAT